MSNTWRTILQIVKYVITAILGGVGAECLF